MGGSVDDIRALMASRVSFKVFLVTLPSLANGKIGRLRCRHTSRLRAAQQNTVNIIYNFLNMEKRIDRAAKCTKCFYRIKNMFIPPITRHQRWDIACLVADPFLISRYAG